MKLSDIITNPVRMKIVQFLQRKGEATTKQISEALTDVPAPTLYRHINYLLKEEVLIVKEERKVRGSLERLLAFNEGKLSENADIDDAAYQFLMTLYGSFKSYSEAGKRDSVADMLSLRTFMLTLTDESYAKLFEEFRAVLEKYSKPEEGGKNRSFSVISAPVMEDQKPVMMQGEYPVMEDQKPVMTQGEYQVIEEQKPVMMQGEYPVMEEQKPVMTQGEYPVMEEQEPTMQGEYPVIKE